MEFRKKLNQVDFPIIISAIVLTFIGIINIYSATHQEGYQVALNQFLSLLIALGIMSFVLFIDYHMLERFAWLMYVLNVIFLILVLAIGTRVMGAQRWLSLGFVRFQPSETMKIFIILALATYLQSGKRVTTWDLRHLLVPFAIIGIPVVLTFVQPDLGTGMVQTLISGTMLLVLKIKRSTLIFFVVTGVLSMPIMWNLVLKPYQKDRILNFINPERDPLVTGYNSIQSKIAVGSGELSGKGYLQGTQTQLNFTPEKHTDFIFSVLSEEHGFLGATSTLIIYAFLFFAGLRVAFHARDKFGCLLALGSVSLIFWHTVINIGMVIGLLPIVGITLPFLSYGGSSLLTSYVCIGIILNVSYRRYMMS